MSSSSALASKTPSANRRLRRGFAAGVTFQRKPARGEWEPGGSTQAGSDAYATSKQCSLATVLAFAREVPRMHFNAVEPSFDPTTSLSFLQCWFSRKGDPQPAMNAASSSGVPFGNAAARYWRKADTRLPSRRREVCSAQISTGLPSTSPQLASLPLS